MIPHSLKTAIVLTLAAPFARAEKVNFNRDVRPILSDTCFHCHGFDEKERKGGLRLDIREAALKGGESGPAFVPGKPDESELVKRLLLPHDDEDLMPPKKLKKPLKPDQIATLKKWIAEGAEYQGHWAFIKPERPAVPADSANPIDAFVLKKIKENGLKPSPEADRATLIRRLSLDLTGVPPTPEETAAFVADAAPNAYEKVVDRLLASPRYGEKMAHQWMDFARYADSNGFQSDTSRQMWHWRDWLIGAYNRNLPFDKFTIEQLAGDMLPNATKDQIVATGFHRNHRLNGEGGRIVEEWFAETVIDRVETTGLTWMAMTLNCCRCHDHKYDPISQKEFYQLFAYFNSNDEKGVLDEFGGAGRTRQGGNSSPVLDLPTPEQAARLAKAEAAIAAANAKIETLKKTAPQRVAAWEAGLLKEITNDKPAWSPLKNDTAKSEGGATLTRQPDGSWLAGGPNPEHDVYTITAPIAPGVFTGLLLDTLPDSALPNQSLGRFSNGNFVLTDVDAEITAPGLQKPLEAMFTRAEAAYEQKGYTVAGIVQDKPKRGKGAKNKVGWAVDGPTRREANKAMFVTAAPLNVPANATIKVTLRHDAIGGHNIGRFRISTTSLPASVMKLDGGSVPENVRVALTTEAAKRTPAQKKELEKLFAASGDSVLKAAEAELAAAKKELGDADRDTPSTMVMREIATPRDAFILNRGEYDKRGDKVARAVPAVFPPLPPGAPNNRLGLAQWLVSGDHPLTARVWVNRAWEKFFGTGIVKTSENFGSQAEWPSHPELLDWLATEFVRLKWDMKAMQKAIVMSATYRQSSKVTPELLAKDPENRLLARAPRLRLSAEVLRDQALAVSGLLVEKLGGPSVKPYMPEGVWDETSVYGDMRGYKADTGEGLYRRTLYTIWKRTAAPPSMLLFDSPNREICTVKRSRTNTPLQALALLNEVTYVEAARVLAQRMILEGGATPEARIAWAFKKTAGRAPTENEVKVLASGIAKRATRLQQNAEEAKKIATVGMSKVDPKVDPVELANYTATANVLLNLDEVINRE
jgi:hypothetical protein